MGKQEQPNDETDSGTPSLADVNALFDILTRADNSEQRARLLACAAIAFSIDESVMFKLKRAR